MPQRKNGRRFESWIIWRLEEDTGFTRRLKRFGMFHFKEGELSFFIRVIFKDRTIVNLSKNIKKIYYYVIKNNKKLIIIFFIKNINIVTENIYTKNSLYL